jgi:hypothetical protein
VHTICVRFNDGSGWDFTRREDSPLWEMTDVYADGSPSTTGIIANDSRQDMLRMALRVDGASITVTREG